MAAKEEQDWERRRKSREEWRVHLSPSGPKPNIKITPTPIDDMELATAFAICLNLLCPEQM